MRICGISANNFIIFFNLCNDDHTIDASKPLFEQNFNEYANYYKRNQYYDNDIDPTHCFILQVFAFFALYHLSTRRSKAIPTT